MHNKNFARNDEKFRKFLDPGEDPKVKIFDGIIVRRHLTGLTRMVLNDGQ